MHSACCWASKVVTTSHKAFQYSSLTSHSRLRVAPVVQRHRNPSILQPFQSAHAVLSQRQCKAVTSTSSVVQMDSDVSQMIQQIYHNPTQAVLYATGGGMQALTWLLTVPGASRTVLESRVPYAQSALQDVLQQSTLSYASVATANSMAEAAYQQAARLSQFGSSIVGVGCTCALMTDRFKKGDHKAFIATHTGSVTRSYSLQLTKGKRDRLGEDSVASKLLLNALATVCSLPQSSHVDIGLLPDSEHIQEDTTQMADPVEELLKGNIQTVEYSNGNVIVNAPRGGKVYMAGSFNPLHEGHRGMLAAALTARQDKQDLLLPADMQYNGNVVSLVRGHAEQVEGCYEMSVGNADKGLMPIEEVKRRVRPFIDENLPLVLTQAPLYPDKTKIFHNSTFVLGYDTAVRLVMPKYYGGHDGMLLQLASMSQLGCSVIVAGRVVTDDQGKSSFKTFEDVEVPDAITDLGLFSSIPESLFRSDISSTELRKKLAEQQK